MYKVISVSLLLTLSIIISARSIIKWAKEFSFCFFFENYVPAGDISYVRPSASRSSWDTWPERLFWMLLGTLCCCCCCVLAPTIALNSCLTNSDVLLAFPVTKRNKTSRHFWYSSNKANDPLFFASNEIPTVNKYLERFTRRSCVLLCKPLYVQVSQRYRMNALLQNAVFTIILR